MTNVMDGALIRVNSWAPPLPVVAPAAVGVATKSEHNRTIAPAFLFLALGALPALYIAHARGRSLATKLQSRGVTARTTQRSASPSATPADRKRVGAIVGASNSLILLDRSGRTVVESIPAASIRGLRLKRGNNNSTFATISIDMGETSLDLMAPNNAETDLALTMIGEQIGVMPNMKAIKRVPGMLGMLPVLVLWAIAALALLMGLSVMASEGFSEGITAVIVGAAFGLAAYQLREYMIRWLNRPGRTP
jgi:hypothetical protein